ncbi:MAG TPA: TonB family protein [Thermoanaerobaculia bacterium]
MAKNVLLIEYEQRDRNRVRSLLGPPEFEVTEARDGEEGLAAFAPSRFDVVLLCGRLPRLSPTDVIRDIRNKARLDAPPIVLLPAGYSGSNTKADAQKIGAFEIVPKPFTDQALLAAVRSALDASGRGAKTMKIPTASLTSSDIFSDLLEEFGRESGPEAQKAPEKGARKPTAPRPPTPPRPSADEEIERRLRDTLSGVRSAARPATPPPFDRGRSSSSRADIDRMLTETLGTRVPRAKPAEPATPPPAVEVTASRRAEPREAVAPEGPDRFGQYEVLEKIASGGMAELFRARRTGVEGFQKIVAIKKILPHIADNDEFITMFADEAKLAAQLNHPNIVHIYDLGKIQAGGYFIAMEYVEGTDLKTILRAGREVDLPLPVSLAAYVAGKVASALDYAHRRRDGKGEELHIVHRDVSPQNILISHEGEIKLCDFGIAKADRKVSQTESGSLKGKLQYMSPEQAWGKPIDHRSDLFSLGAVLHEMLTGERLFRGDSDLVVLELVRKAEVEPPSRVNPDVPSALDAVVLKALAREPENRYATGSEMLRDLESVLYSYSPAPGAADLAIYLDRLREARASAAELRSEAAARAPAAAPIPAAREAVPVAEVSAGIAPAPRSVSEATGSPVAGPAGEAGVFGSFSPARIESEKKGRAPLYIGMAAVVAIGVFLAVLLARKSPAPAPASAVTPAPAPKAVPVAVEITPAAFPPTPVARTVEQEVQRQLAAKRLEAKNQKAVEMSASRLTALPRSAAVPTAVPARINPVVVARVEPTSAPALTSPPPEPTEAVLAPASREPAETIASRDKAAAAPREAASQAAAPPEPEVARGDLVGPGPGVVEPALLSPPRINYPPMARQQKISGRVVILVLVNEQGSVSDARVQKGIGGRNGIDTVVLDAVRSSHFRPATKNGIPVKMWRTILVDVRP